MGQTKLPFKYTVCIDDLIGPKAKAKGCKCPCAKCSPEGPEETAVGRSADRQIVQEKNLLDRPPAPRRIPFDAIRDGTEKLED